MGSLSVQPERPRAQHLAIREDSLVVELTDGRTISVPLAWYPRLLHGNPKERSNWRLIGAGEGIHWPELDEDLSIEGLIAGNPSGESGKSFKRWLESRKTDGFPPTRGRTRRPHMQVGRRRLPKKSTTL